MSDPTDRPALFDVAGKRLGLGDHVTVMGGETEYVVTALDPPAGLVTVSGPGGEVPAIPATLRRVGAPVSLGDTVTDGGTQFVVLGVVDDVLFCGPVFGGAAVELDRGAVRRVGERPAVPSTALDLGEVLGGFGRRASGNRGGPGEGRVLPLRRRAGGAA